MGLNMYDYGARNYDPAIGRWMNIDPLAEEYCNVTPYNYSANNPVFFVDYDGEDYGIYIDHEKKTVSYKANYYFNSGADLAANIASMTDWMKLQGGYTNKDGEVYNISFELKGIVAGEGETAEGLAAKDDIGNSIVELNDADFEAKYNEMGKSIGKVYNKDIGGVTRNSKYIYNRTSVSNKNTRSHEMGHTFGESDSPDQVGVMQYADSFANMSEVQVANGSQILRRDYKENKNNNLNIPSSSTNGVRTIEVKGTYSIGNFIKGKKLNLEKK